jgi:putative drug exporter of the RND superfamily
VTWLQHIVYWMTTRLLGPIIRRRFAYVEGLEHVPSTGPVVLVANHSSFFDHFLLAASVAGRRSGRLYFLTKQESFSSRLGRLWFRSVGAIPVDRESPKPETLREIRRVLSAGDVLCVYPEGTRGPGWPLLPFKTGAVRFGLTAGAPIVPVGIWGAQDILPKGTLIPRRAQARVVIGPELYVRRDIPRGQQIEAVTADAQETVRGLVLAGQTVGADERARAARRTAELAEAEIESALEHGDDSADVAALARAAELLRLARMNDPSDVHTEVQGLRLRGLRGLHARALAAFRVALPIGRRARRVLERDPENAMAHYVLGRWHLRMPRLIGGRRSLAVTHLRRATELGGEDTRFATGLAEALVATREIGEARAVLTDVIDRSGASPRERRRVERAMAERARLAHGSKNDRGPSATTPETSGGSRGAGTVTGALRRHPRRVIAVWLVLAAASIPFALQLTPALKAGGFTNPRGGAAKAAGTLAHSFGDDTNALFVVLHDSRGDVRSAIPAALPALERIPGLRAIRTSDLNPQWLARNHRTTLIEASLNLGETAAVNQVAPLRARLANALSGRGISSEVTGSPALDHDLNVQSQRDVERAEMFAFPVLLIVLLLVFQSFAAVAVSLSLAVIAIVITNAIGYAVAQAAGVSILFSNAVTMIGLAVGVDYGLFILKRFREERATGADIEAAVERAMSSAGRSVLLSGFAVLVALCTLLIPRVMVLSSIALGAGVVTCVALALAMTFLPAILQLGGSRLSQPTLRLRLPVRSRRGGLEALLGRLYRRPGLLLVVVAIGTGALVYPLAGLRLQVPVASASILPANDEARAAVERLERNLGMRNLFPVEVVLSAPRSVGGAELIHAARTVSGIAAADPRVTTVLSISNVAPAPMLDSLLSGRTTAVPGRVRAALNAVWASEGGQIITRVVITPAQGPDTVVAHQLVAALQARLHGAVDSRIKVGVTGATAQGADFDGTLIRAFPFIVGAVALVTFALLALAFGSLLLPLLALLLNAVVVTASMGVLVRLFAPGHDQSINSITPVLLFAVTFGLSMDYMVIMLSRIREFHRGGADHRHAVITGVGRTALMVNGAAAIMVAVFVSFGTAQISIVRELGIGLAVAIAIDAVVIRLLVMPAALLVLGPRVWGRRAQQGDPVEPLLDESPGAPPAQHEDEGVLVGA